MKAMSHYPRKYLAFAAALAFAALYVPSAHSIEIGAPSGEKGGFAVFGKDFFGDYAGGGAPSENVWSSSASMSAASLADGTTSYYSDVGIVPGNTYYYYFKYLGAVETKTPVYRTVYISTGSPGYVIVDGAVYGAASLVTAATVWHNWSDAPPPPANLTAFWSGDNDMISLEWDNPQAAGASVADLVGGGGYEIYRSSESYSAGMILVASVTAISSRMDYPDNGVASGATYYYLVRSYDAYAQPMFSSYSQVTPQSRRTYVVVSFIADVSSLESVKSVSVVGDFTSPPFYKGRIPMSYDGSGRWKADVSDVSLYAGADIKYKYFVNDEIYEPDIPLPLGGPYRSVKIKDEGSRRMSLDDVWSVWTPTGTPSNLPPMIVGFSAEPAAGVVNLKWDCDPFSTGTVLGYRIARSSAADGAYAVTASTDVLRPAVFGLVDAVADGTTVYYKIASVGKDGSESPYSDWIKACPPVAGSFVPQYNVSPREVFLPDDFSWGIGGATGEIILRWNPAARDSVYGRASGYVVRYASFPITSAAAFRAARVAGAAKGVDSGVSILTTLSMGDYCPGYYFAVCAVYGSWHLVGFSTSTVATAPKAFAASDGGLVEKRSRLPGDSASAVASYEIPAGALPKGNYLAVVRSMGELVHDATYSAKISAARAAALKDERFAYDTRNDLPEHSSVFAFELYGADKKDYFSGGERLSRKDMTVSLSYNGLEAAPEDLRVGVLNEKNNFWRIMKDVKPEIDRDGKLIKFKTRHLSVYGLFRAPAAAADLSGVAVYPNPFKPYDSRRETGDYSTGIKFVNLTRKTEITVYNIAGELVRAKGLESDEYGECLWDAKNDDGEYAASGVYVFVAKDDAIVDGVKKFVGKIGIVR